MTAVLREMQSLLAGLYDVPGEYDVCDFLVTERRELSRYISTPPADEVDEQVLVSESDDGVRIGVYIDAGVLDRLASDNPLRKLSDTNLRDYCTALEGVSHFHYLAWRATHANPVSLLELELQAEVDKYAAATRLLTEQRSGSFPFTLHERLFHGIRYASGLDGECRARYHVANRHAARFCRGLDERFLRARRARPEAWLAELRGFYRCGHGEKVRRACA